MHCSDVITVLYPTPRTDVFKVYSELDMKTYELSLAELKQELTRGNEVVNPHGEEFFDMNYDTVYDLLESDDWTYWE